VPKLPDDGKHAHVVHLGPSEHYVVEQALADATNFAKSGPGLEDVLIVGYDKDGQLFMRSSHMSREWALWLVSEMKDYIRQVGRYSE
jgi:hypothetical protein